MNSNWNQLMSNFNSTSSIQPAPPLQGSFPPRPRALKVSRYLSNFCYFPGTQLAVWKLFLSAIFQSTTSVLVRSYCFICLLSILTPSSANMARRSWNTIWSSLRHSLAKARLTKALLGFSCHQYSPDSIWIFLRSFATRWDSPSLNQSSYHLDGLNF